MSSACMPPDDRPAKEPDAICEGCGARGTVGRISRHNGESRYVEEHRYCEQCWPQWMAYHRALWEERGRRESGAWRESLDRGSGQPLPSPDWGMVIASATWHGVIEMVDQITAPHPRRPPTREELGRIAADIQQHAAERVGPMPLEVRDFLAQFGGAGSDTTPLP